MKAAQIVGWNLRRARVAKGLSQEALSVDADVDVSYVSRLENGLENPSIGVLERLCSALGIEIQALFKKPLKATKLPKPLRSGRKPK